MHILRLMDFQGAWEGAKLPGTRGACVNPEPVTSPASAAALLRREEGQPLGPHRGWGGSCSRSRCHSGWRMDTTNEHGVLGMFLSAGADDIWGD